MAIDYLRFGNWASDILTEMDVSMATEPGAEWDAFVESSGGGLGHASAWRHAVREGYGLESDYLVARSGGSWQGVLPLVRFRGLNGRLELVSMPFLDTGGILALSPDAADALRQAAFDLARSLGAAAVELRALADASADRPQPRVDLAMDLASSEEAQWNELRAKVRNQTRKADKEGLCVAEGDRGALLSGFFGPFCQNMRDLGSPVHSERFFAAASEAFAERWRFVVTRLGDRDVGGLVAIHFADAVSVPWASTLRSERRRCPNNQIYWEAIRWAIGRGAGTFDFGRSPVDSGTYRFKRGWGASERPLHWQRFDADGREQPWKSAAESPWLQRLSQLWTRLPVGLASALGPRIRGRISS